MYAYVPIPYARSVHVTLGGANEAANYWLRLSSAYVSETVKLIIYLLSVLA
jgi:hypothetical protein